MVAVHPRAVALVVGLVGPDRVRREVDVRLQRERHVGQRAGRRPAVPDRERVPRRQLATDVSQQRASVARGRVRPLAVGAVAVPSGFCSACAAFSSRDRRWARGRARAPRPGGVERREQAVGRIAAARASCAAAARPRRCAAGSRRSPARPRLERRQHVVQPLEQRLEVVEARTRACRATSAAGRCAGGSA